MPENPYQSPHAPREPVDAEPSLRMRARISFRVAFLLLLVPAVYNYWAFDDYTIGSNRLAGGRATLYRTVNILGFIVGGSLIWFCGLPLLENVARRIRTGFANWTDQTAWQDTLYRSLSWSAFFAIPGAALWVAWVFLYYHRQMNFYTISWAIGIPAHGLAACLYVPLFYAWYRLATSPPNR